MSIIIKHFPNSFLKTHTNSPFMQRRLSSGLTQEQIFNLKEESRPSYKKYNKQTESSNLTNNAKEHLIYSSKDIRSYIENKNLISSKHYKLFIDREMKVNLIINYNVDNLYSSTTEKVK